MRLFIPLLASAVTAVPSVSKDKRSNNYPPELEITGATMTSKWFEGSDLVQIVEMYIKNNAPTNSLTLKDTLNITMESESLALERSGTLQRLYPGQQAVVQIGVKNKEGVAGGSTCSGTIVATFGGEYGQEKTARQEVTGVCGIPDYTADTGSLGHHWTPQWYNDAKYGIFIHWGIYSIPAYGSTGDNIDYAEWYWYRQHDPNWKTKTYQYHRDTYGEDFNYDDFIANFTADAYNPKEWVDLIADAGAMYMVPVTKHHDGFSLFNMPDNVSRRHSVALGPKRDLLKDLIDAAKQYHPEIRRGTYFSMPEWYNPAYRPYYQQLMGPNYYGGENVNPYTGAEIEYTGYSEVDDFVTGIQRPQMDILSYDYETELMWCDIGGPNNSTLWASEWINWARDQGRQVTLNNRCGIPGDFETPEYVTKDNVQVSKWESNRGMDPFSFGYNFQSPDDEYLDGNDIVQSLVDMVSKNGNFLLDIGPTGNGSIPQIMKTGLLDAGAWIKAHGESIYGSRFWDTTPGSGNFRYTTKPDAFYIHYLTQPPATIDMLDPVPWLPGDTVTALGGGADGTAIEVTQNGDRVRLHVPENVINGDQYVWTFKIAYTSDW